jgi:riboflavin synthase
LFTGIISDIGKVVGSKKNDRGLQITFERPEAWQELKEGDSISINGACLTIESLSETSFSCTLIPETLAKTIFADNLPEQVNLERAMLLSSRLDGHIVLGHVDGTGNIVSIDRRGNEGYVLNIEFEKSFEGLVIKKGSICVNGVALTIADLNHNCISLALIPYTLKNTTLGLLELNDKVNLEYDVLGKYITKNLKPLE